MAEVLCSASDKAKLLVKNCFKNYNLDYLGISLPIFPSRPNSDCNSVVVLENCEPELSYIIAELFNMCLKESCFSDC